LKYNDYAENELFSVIEPVCRGFNTEVVQLNSAVIKTALQVRLVLHKKGGIDIDSCTQISRAVMPRIEVWADNRDVNLEVSSPGVGRTLKDAWEFHLFIGERIKLLIGNDWLEGTITSADDKSVTIQSGDNITGYSYDQILKAKLD